LEVLKTTPILKKSYEKKYYFNEEIFIKSKDNINKDEHVLALEQKLQNLNVEIPNFDFLIDDFGPDIVENVEIIEKKEVSSSNSQNKKDSRLEDLLKKIDVPIPNDFLEEYEEYDVPILTDTIGLIDEEENYHYTESKYFNKEQLNIGGFDVKLRDIFVTPPKSKWKRKEGVGYMLTQLKNLDSYYIIQLFYQFEISKHPNYCTLSNFIKNLDYMIDLLDYNSEKKSDHDHYCYLYLYKLLCSTFITNEINDKDEKRFFIQDGKIILAILMRNIDNNKYLSLKKQI